jgi:two-component system, NarL family, response regulator DesR
VPSFHRKTEPALRPSPFGICVGVVASDRAVFRQITRALATSQFSIAAISFEITELLLETQHLDLDVVIWHSHRSPPRLAETAARLHKQLPDASLVAVSRFPSAQELRRAMDAGLDALVLESQLPIALAAAVLTASAGQLSIPREVRRQIYRPTLSHGERQVLLAVANGLTNSEIAAKLHISPSTVKSRLSNAFTKLGVSSREEAAAAMADLESAANSIR